MSVRSFLRWSPLAICGLAGCSLIDAAGIQTDYTFDALEYASMEFGDSKAMKVVPDVACEPSDQNSCNAASVGLPLANVSLACDSILRKCVAQAEVSVSETVDLSKQMESAFPSQAVQYGVDVVDVKRITYWINKNTLTVSTPAIDFYVAPAAARDENDAKAVLVASIAALGAHSNVCADPAFTQGDPKANTGTPVCSAPLRDAGKSALGSFVKDYKTPFQVIAHTVIIAMPGEPLPGGSISFAMRPTVGLKILD